MQHGVGLPRYTGTAPMMPFAPWRGMMPPGRCRKCGQPSGDCCCGCRECRKEAKELVVTPDTTQRGAGDTGISALNLMRMLKTSSPQEQQPAPAAGTVGSGIAFIGGGCCVTLGVEYAPTTTTVAFAAIVMVADSEGTVLLWGREEPAGTSYRVHECIITTKPGASLIVVTLNCTARVRWCEVFSC